MTADIERILAERILVLDGATGTELVDGFLILLAAAFMLTPGFLTDVVAILLLLPPVRAGGIRASWGPVRPPRGR